MQDEHSPEQIQQLFASVSHMLSDYYDEPEKHPASPGVEKRWMVDNFSQPVLPEQGIGLEKTLGFFRDKVLPNSVKSWHPLFLNQMSAGASVPAILGDLLASMINCTMATWEMTPAATIMERNVTQWMAQLMGMKSGSSGIFLPGGSLSNTSALMVARNQRLGPEVASDGLGRHRGVILCSEGAHYSIANAANLMGLGSRNVIKIRSNERNEMLPEDLIEKLAWCDDQGLEPFAIVATMGLTVTGGFDPLGRIVEICKDRNIHIHVDAAFGGGLALTRRGTEVFAGIEHADTVIWDAHKWFHVPLTCTVLLAPDARIFEHTFSSGADYLFHPQEEDIDIADDLGKYTLMCGKRFDGLPVWMLLQAYGAGHFREMAEDRVRFTDTIYQRLLGDADFEPSYQPISPIICFRFRPQGYENWSPAYADRLHRWVRETAKRRKLAMFNITKHKGSDHFRMILINHLTTEDHIYGLIEGIRDLAREFMTAEPPVHT